MPQASGEETQGSAGSGENTQSDGGRSRGDEGGRTPAERDEWERDRHRTYQDRDKAKAEKKKLSDENAELRKRLDELEPLAEKSLGIDKHLEREAKKRQAAEEDARQAREELNAFQSNARRGALVGKLTEVFKLPEARVRGLMLAAREEDPDLVIDPDGIDDNTIKVFDKIFRRIDPASFTSSQGEAPRSRPGAPVQSEHGRRLPQTEQVGGDPIAKLEHSVREGSKGIRKW
jgi:hypothetical protein